MPYAGDCVRDPGFLRDRGEGAAFPGEWRGASGEEKEAGKEALGEKGIAEEDPCRDGELRKAHRKSLKPSRE